MSSKITLFSSARERESLKDAEDRKKELDEIEELKSAIYSDPALSDPAQEFQRTVRHEIDFRANDVLAGDTSVDPGLVMGISLWLAF